jgi:hypothetical protein
VDKFDPEAIRLMTDEQLLRLSRILRITKAVHEYGAEDEFVAQELGRRLNVKLAVPNAR